ncbi:hypothetical protein MRB53_039591 [Persea americana]|nr:hypothetical protein MRB53_039591 [Persea americana]
MTSCGHTFCSICIRRALNVDGRCPACRTPEEESKLRKNLLVEDLLEVYIPLRDSLMRYTDLRKNTVTDSASRIILDSEGEETEPVQSQSSRRSTRLSRSTKTMEEDATNKIPAGHVLCPVCNKPFHLDQIELHVDSCLTGGVESDDTARTRSQYFDTPDETQARASRHNSAIMKADEATTETPKRLPKPNYAVMNDTKLRRSMGELGLSTSGTRAILQKRYTEYIALWNSNLDSKQPKSKRDLLRELQAWDRIQSKASIKVTNEEIDAAHKNGEYKDNFKDLIAQG